MVIRRVDDRDGIVDALHDVEVNAVRMHSDAIRPISYRDGADDRIAVVGGVNHRDSIVVLIGHIEARATLVYRGPAWSVPDANHLEHSIDRGRSRGNVDDRYRVVVGVGHIGARSGRIDCNIARE